MVPTPLPVCDKRALTSAKAQVGCRYNESHFKTNLTADMTDPKTWMCLICGWIYDEAAGLPEDGIAAGTPWAQVPMNWVCVRNAAHAKKTLKWCRSDMVHQPAPLCSSGNRPVSS
jgi:rubredoxin